jgi:hypothetical protein
VYCYGPNTQFDRQVIREIKPGRGWFEIKYEELLLAPGDYKISVAIWDKNEALPFDYHSGCYDLKISGSNAAKELLRIPCKIKGRASLPGEWIAAFDTRGDIRKEETGIKIGSVQWVDVYGVPKDVLRTREAATLKINIADTLPRGEKIYFWAGIFRNDGVYCQGFVAPRGKEQCYNFVFPELPLLPGGYTVSVRAWDAKVKKILACRDGAVSFRIVFDREDHGTVHLEHAWKWEFRK